MTSLAKALQKLSITQSKNAPIFLCSVRQRHVPVPKPVIGNGKSYRRIVHFTEKYTVKPLEVTNLGGRDPETGRLAVKGIGGGIKHKYHWIDWKRVGPTEGPPQVERVIKIIKDGCRTAHVALVACGDRLKYIIATENMKAGDLIKTSCHIPRIPVRPNEGDAYPLGALPIGTQINCVEMYPGLGGFLVHSAGTFATILRKAPNNRVIIMMPSKKEFSLLESCMCTVGRVSNVEYASTPIGSAQKNRELGNRPRSGWWQRKTGRFGRKIRKPPPVKVISPKDAKNTEVVTLSFDGLFSKTLNHQFHY
ncbi:39S ribosomal protein L2, mitochondrial [Asbolus verrucosus]|uniref:39S ribosomal protein L2, mitochondrial n=1 Tax=Asbolus verrucosus TaxID=1661398 RepID=A0A482VCZ8_ASBVE|nr:39S ribosomal protein L2, mitochondrial [Asbolus verrucosus]